jgi:photosystem II stability/assembly factor-like uncharacterized protein
LAAFGNLPHHRIGWHSDLTLSPQGPYFQGPTESVSCRFESRINRKLLLALLILLFAAPALCARRWLPFGPDSHLQVNVVRADRFDRQLLYLASDRGVFVSRDGGLHWDQTNNGLHGYAVLALVQAINGTWVAGTNHGIFLLQPGANAWRASDTVVNEQGTPRIIHVKGVTRRVMAHHSIRTVLQSRINDIEVAPNRWLAATSTGIFSSSDQGKIWSGGPVGGEKNFIAIKAEKELVTAATASRLLVSIDGGTVWKQAALPCPASTSIYDVLISPDSRIFVATSEGALRSSDGGATWEHLKNGLPSREVGSMTFDSQSKRLVAYSNGLVFESKDRGQNWRHVEDVGLGVSRISVLDGRLFATTGSGLLVSSEKAGDDSQEADRTRGNWFLRLVHKSE